MKSPVFGLCMVMVALVMAGPAHAELMSFESDFTSWTGTDAGATSPVSSSTGHAPASDWTVTYDGATGEADPGWLTQGDIGGTLTTAKFTHDSQTTSARARFSAALPAEWVYYGLQDTSLQVDFRLKCYSGYDGGGGPIQISYPTVYGMFAAYIRVRQQGAQIRPLNSGTNDVQGVQPLSLPLGSDWHSWTVVATYGEYADYGDGAKHWAYWDLYVDGAQYFFGGVHGSPVFNGRTYSFRTSRDDVSSREPLYILRGDGRIGLGEMRDDAEKWGFEFDYVNFSADYVPQPPLTELYRWEFDTTGDAQSWNLYNEIYHAGGPAPAEYIAQQDTYTFIGTPPAGQSQTVFVNLMGRDPADWPWGGVNPTSGGALYSQRAGDWGMWLLNGVKLELGLTADVMAIEFNLSNTTNRDDTRDLDVWVDFYVRAPGDPYDVARLRSKRLSAEGSNQTNPWKWSRTRYNLAEFPAMELVAGSKWWETPGTYPFENLNWLFAVNFVAHPGTEEATPAFIDDIRLYGPPCGFVTPEDAQAITVSRNGVADPIIYTVSHTGPGEISYTVAETDAAGSPHDYPWLSLDKTGGGPLANGESDPVTVTITDTAMEPAIYTAYVTFVDTCDPAYTHIRRIDMTVLPLFADVDDDGDVDQDDFGALQACITGMDDPTGVFDPENCGHFDRDGDEDVDDWDLADFEACATGPGILWAPTPECP